MLDFWGRRRWPRNHGNTWFLGHACTGFEAPGGGPKSQAPDIRCLTFGAAAGGLETAGTQRFLGNIGNALGEVESQAPDIRCLTFEPRKSSTGYPALDLPNRPRKKGKRTRVRKGSRGICCRRLRKIEGGPNEPKVKHRISGA